MKTRRNISQGVGKATTVTLSPYTLELLNEMCEGYQLKRSAIVTSAIIKYYEFYLKDQKRMEEEGLIEKTEDKKENKIKKEKGGRQWGR